MGSTLGHSLRITSYGESHGRLIGLVLDGLPAGIEIDQTQIQADLDRRKPGQSAISSPRKEADEFEIVSGIYENKTTGTPLAIEIRNTDQKSEDYDHLIDVYRPGHADFVYQEKYGIRDHRGGGRSSARITAAWVAGGSIVKSFLLKQHQISIQAVVSRVADLAVEDIFNTPWEEAENNPVRCPDSEKAKHILDLIAAMKEVGDSLGGVISCRIKNCPPGLGEPVFDKLNAEIAKAVFSINAVKGIEFGSGFAGTAVKGSENNDVAGSDKNNDGGISGGISNGREIRFNTAFKPVSSIALTQDAYNRAGEIVKLNIQGRHDPCVLPRAVPIVETMAAFVVADHLLMNLKYKK